MHGSDASRAHAADGPGGGGCVCERLTPPVRVVVRGEMAPLPADAARVAAAEFAAARARNPRVHNGPVLAVAAVSTEPATLTLERTDYARLLATPTLVARGLVAPEQGVRSLGVTALLRRGSGVADDAAPVFLARRSAQTRVYGGLWEIGPSGGAELPAGFLGGTALDLVPGLLAEIAEEAGGAVEVFEGVEPRAGWVLSDPVAGSVDVVFEVAVGVRAGAAVGEGDWEYTESRWLTPAALAAFDRAHGGEISPPTRVLCRARWPGLAWSALE